jgi:hypothetical protein
LFSVALFTSLQVFNANAGKDADAKKTTSLLKNAGEFVVKKPFYSVLLALKT